jgi:hypothetical protein
MKWWRAIRFLVSHLDDIIALVEGAKKSAEQPK